jgi:glycine/D-amino acid oxidase-like deaminating enzyme
MRQAQDLMARLTTILPGIGPVRPEASRVTIRPIPRDGLSAVGPIPNVEGYYLVVTHSGATLSPALGEIVADEIITGMPRPELASFRPSRFLNEGTEASPATFAERRDAVTS